MINNFLDKEYHNHNVIIDCCDRQGPLLLGDVNAVTDSELIAKHNVKTIITAAMGMEHVKPASHVNQITYPLSDNKRENISQYFQQSFSCIDDNLKKGGVLVHCAAGISRSATLVIAYMMKKNTWTFKEAMAFVKSKRPEICPNLGFQLQLKQYEKVVTNSNLQGTIRNSKGLIPTKNLAAHNTDVIPRKPLNQFAFHSIHAKALGRLPKETFPHIKPELQLNNYRSNHRSQGLKKRKNITREDGIREDGIPRLVSHQQYLRRNIASSSIAGYELQNPVSALEGRSRSIQSREQVQYFSANPNAGSASEGPEALVSNSNARNIVLALRRESKSQKMARLMFSRDLGMYLPGVHQPAKQTTGQNLYNSSVLRGQQLQLAAVQRNQGKERGILGSRKR